MTLGQQIKQEARQFGFQAVGISLVPQARPSIIGASATDLQGSVPPTKTVKNDNLTVTTSASNNEAPAKSFPGLPIWESKKEKMISVVGNSWWNSWMGKAVPLSDDGTTLTLAVPSPFYRDRFRSQECLPVGRLERILQRRFEFIVDPRLKKNS